MEKLLTLYFFSLAQMSLFTWFWVLLGLEWNKKFYRTVLFIILSAITYTLCLPIANKYGHYICYIFILLIAKIIFVKNLKILFLDIFFIFFIFYFIQSIHILLYRNIYPDLEVYTLHINSSFISIFILNIVTFILIGSVRLSKKLTALILDFKMVIENNPKLLVFMILSIVLLQLSSDLYYEVFWEKYYKFFLIVWSIFILNFIYIKKNLDLFVHKKEIELYKKNNDIVCEMLEDAKRRQHEFKNHLTTIYSLQKIEINTDYMKNYIQSVCKSISIPPDIYKLENKLIAAVLFSKLGIAKENDIIFEYYLNYINRFPVADYQLVEIISNLLNNAFEAVQDIEKLKKIVFLEIDTSQNIPYILIKNNGPALLPSDIPQIFKQGYSKKNCTRGYGLYNVNKIVKRNNGQIEVLFDKEYTVFKISFECNGGMYR